MHFNCKTYDPVLVSGIASEYANGVAMWRLAEKHHIASKTLKKLLSGIGVQHRGVKAAINVSREHATANLARRKLSPERREQFCSRYNSGLVSVADLAAEFDISESNARKILRDQEHIFREPAFRSYHVNSDFFSVIDSATKAYWFGFIMADGCVFSGRSPGLRIGLKASDSGHLESFKVAIRSDHPVKFSTHKYILHGETRHAEACAIDIRDKTLFDSLVSHGCIPNKTNVDTAVTGIPDRLFRHFVRGYFDGDGCIVFHSRKNRTSKSGLPTIEQAWSCVGNGSIMSYLRDGICQCTGLVLSGIKQHHGCWHLRASGIHKVESLFHFLYDDGGPFLQRKKIKWEKGRRIMGLYAY
ncbi:hypothetical protein [Oryzomonas rubra]|uniref:Homing endonuclease LAGLIDADG domain-containing protein n=1 Tax=Oryzomonas rubra TaxID=2509454 RepID=A0A5A9X6V5_9BACT|nr:hypothetical protein [Oryzomonas rubra]KAA0888766.1 hypothetical protein ET418_15410 [Oryzomonas rubra]